MLIGIAGAISVAASGFIFHMAGHMLAFLIFAAVAGMATILAWLLLRLGLLTSQFQAGIPVIFTPCLTAAQPVPQRDELDPRYAIAEFLQTDVVGRATCLCRDRLSQA